MKYTMKLRDAAKKTRYLSEEAGSEMMTNLRIFEDVINSQFKDVQDVGIQKYLERCDELNSQMREMGRKIEDIIEYSTVMERWCTGNYNINDI